MSTRNMTPVRVRLRDWQTGYVPVCEENVIANYRKNNTSLTQVGLFTRVKSIGGRSLPEARIMRMTSKKVEQKYQRGFHVNTVCLERFFNRRNVGLYRKLADRRTGAAKRREILELLAQEQIRFRSDL